MGKYFGHCRHTAAFKESRVPHEQEPIPNCVLIPVYLLLLRPGQWMNRIPLDFDFTKVVEASKDNPVFYVQYAHARVSSLKRKAAEAGVDLAQPADLSLLDEEELGLVKRAAQYSRVLESAALAHEPHRIAFYLYDLAAEFHALWNRGNDDPERRFLLDKNPQLSRARLELALGIAQIIRSGLDLMGVAATEEMR